VPERCRRVLFLRMGPIRYPPGSSSFSHFFFPHLDLPLPFLKQQPYLIYSLFLDWQWQLPFSLTMKSFGGLPPPSSCFFFFFMQVRYLGLHTPCWGNHKVMVGAYSSCPFFAPFQPPKYLPILSRALIVCLLRIAPYPGTFLSPIFLSATFYRRPSFFRQGSAKIR